MKFRLLPLSVAAVAFVFLLSACAAPNLRDPQLLQDSSLIDNTPCAAPCWRGITPGVTNWNEAFATLQDDATLENVTVQTDEETAAKVAEFQQRGGSAGCCQMYSEDGQIVDLLFMRVAPTVTLGQLFEAQGEPAYALSTEYSSDQAIVNLVYPDIPMVIYAFVPGPTGSLTEASEIIGTLYMTPDNMELLIQTSNLHAWVGYTSFTEYGPEQPFEVTPEITLSADGTPILPDGEATADATAEAATAP